MSDEAATILATELKWPMAQVRQLLGELEAKGVQLVYAPVSDDVCPCGYHYQNVGTGLCTSCETKRLLEKRESEREAEERRYVGLLEDAKTVLKKRDERMREKFKANPRKYREWREKWKLLREFVAEIQEWRDEHRVDSEPNEFGDDEELMPPELLGR